MRVQVPSHCGRSYWEETFGLWMALRNPNVTVRVDFSRQACKLQCSSAFQSTGQDCMTPLNPMDSAYMFNNGHVKVLYVADTPYPYAGGQDLARARSQLPELVQRGPRACAVSWFQVPGWTYVCPEDTIGFAYAWSDGELHVELSPKAQEVGYACAQSCGYGWQNLMFVHMQEWKRPIITARMLLEPDGAAAKRFIFIKVS